LEQRFRCHLGSTHRWVSVVMFFEMRHSAAPAFKRTYIGQTLRPLNQSHVLSAAWAQRQLGPRAFSIHDEARLSAIHARLHWLHLLVEHSLAVVEGREHTTQTSAKKKTDGTLNHYNEWPPVSSPTLQSALRAHRHVWPVHGHCMLRVPSHRLFHFADAVNPAKCPKRSIPVSLSHTTSHNAYPGLAA
jgi:hypothetical protein